MEQLETTGVAETGRPEPRAGYLERLAEEIGRHANARAVFGDPVERDGVTVIPVARARWGFGGSSAWGEKSCESGGGGMVVSPVGYIEVTNEGSRFRPITDPARMGFVLLAGAALGLWLLRKRK